jgi:hypothetical protein
VLFTATVWALFVATNPFGNSGFRGVQNHFEMIYALGFTAIKFDDVVPPMGNASFGNVACHLIGVNPRYNGFFFASSLGHLT